MTTSHYDLYIIGCGLVGAALLRALADQDLSIAVVEAREVSSASTPPPEDDRAIALSLSSQRFFDAVGLWPTLAAYASPIKQVHISNQGHFGLARLDHRELQQAALGYVLPATRLSQQLQQSVQNLSNVSRYQPATLISINEHATHLALALQTADKTTTLIHTRLLIMADGGQSRELAGLNIKQKQFDQAAIVTNLSISQAHNGVAYERFTTSGPLALLPLKGNRCSLVWTLPKDQYQAYLELSDIDFLHRLQQQFGWRLGELSHCGKRSAWQLTQHYLPQPGRGRMICIGNAAHQLHPVAGQGLNLALRDIAYLADLLVNSKKDSLALVRDYVQQRGAIQMPLIKSTALLIDLFSNDQAGLTLLRNAGILGLDQCRVLKVAVMRYLTGLEDSQANLLRGLPL